MRARDMHDLVGLEPDRTPPRHERRLIRGQGAPRQTAPRAEALRPRARRRTRDRTRHRRAPRTPGGACARARRCLRQPAPARHSQRRRARGGDRDGRAGTPTCTRRRSDRRRRSRAARAYAPRARRASPYCAPRSGSASRAVRSREPRACRRPHRARHARSCRPSRTSSRRRRARLRQGCDRGRYAQRSVLEADVRIRAHEVEARHDRALLEG